MTSDDASIILHLFIWGICFSIVAGWIALHLLFAGGEE